MSAFQSKSVPRFGRAFFDRQARFTRIGDGELGGKAAGLVLAADLLDAELDRRPYPGIDVDVPASVVVTTEAFDQFLTRNELWDVALSGAADDRIALAFQQGHLPAELVGDLRALVEEVRVPLAVRSSSRLEDAMSRPFAGVYETKMIANDQSDAGERFAKLVEAIKFVWASMFRRSARSYLRASGKAPRDEKMAVVLQEVVGRRHGDRFYPDLSAVAKSWNFYPSGAATPEEGVVSLALGLGKTIVDGGATWTYSPVHPRSPRPFGSVRDLLERTQLRFWAVRMGRPPVWDPTAETEYMVELDLAAADDDGTLRYTASTYDAQADRLWPGVGGKGPRALTFAPILEREEIALNAVLRDLLALFARELATPVEMELACTIEPGPRARLALLQVRPMVVSEDVVEVDPAELTLPGLLLASDSALGNGTSTTIRDVVWVDPATFDVDATRQIAAEVAQLNDALVAEQRPYLLIGFGRWGSSDPFLGIPVSWGQISGAQAIVEAGLPRLSVDPSQGSHFFHNLSSFRAFYFTVPPGGRIDWEWLARQPLVARTAHVGQVRLSEPLTLRVDGRSRRGGVWLPPGERQGGDGQAH